jgi:hypothetical protein
VVDTSLIVVPAFSQIKDRENGRQWRIPGDFFLKEEDCRRWIGNGGDSVHVRYFQSAIGKVY